MTYRSYYPLDNTLDKQEKRILYFRKNPTFGSQIFTCMECSAERIYGHDAGTPENRNVLILCEGSCNKNTLHRFTRTHLGREQNA